MRRTWSSSNVHIKIFVLILSSLSVLAFGTQARGFKPDRSRRILRAKKILSMPSFGAEVKPSVPCRKINGHVQEPESDVEVATFGKIPSHFSHIVPPSTAGVR